MLVYTFLCPQPVILFTKFGDSLLNVLRQWTTKLFVHEPKIDNGFQVLELVSRVIILSVFYFDSMSG